MPFTTPPTLAGYSFASWPAAPPVFEALPAVPVLWVPVGGSPDMESIQLDAVVERTAHLVAPDALHAASLAPARGRRRGVRRGVLTNGRDVHAVELEPDGDPDPVWLASDDSSLIPHSWGDGTDQLVGWLERFRAAGIWADRHDSPDLLAQLHTATRRPIDTIICSVIDADPSACLNSALVAWYAIDLIAGVALLARIARAGRAIVVIDSRLPPAWTSSLRRSAARTVEIVPLIPDYPQSDPTLMLYTLLNRRLHPGRLPVEQGVIQLDASAAIALGRCALQGAPTLSVPLALRDHVLRQTFFLFAPIGTRAIDVRQRSRVSDACTELRGGDVLRDLVLPDSALISAGGELVLHTSAPQPPVYCEPCVRCGWCVEACPTRVQPAGVLEAAQHDDVSLAKSYGMSACIECGICTYVCPSRLPLMQSVRRMKLLTVAADHS